MNSIDSEIKKSYSFYTEQMDLLNRPDRFLKVFASILEHTNYRYILDLYSKLSTKCSRCTVSCQIYQASNRSEDIPCYRSELLLKVYRRHFTYKGLFDGRVFGKRGLSDEDIDEMAESFYHCTACRRCTVECPMGIEHGLITHLGRWILAEIGIAPKALVVATREQLEGNTANTSAIPAAAMIDTCEFLEEELQEDKGIDIKFPIDVEDAEYIFFPAVSDFLLEPDTLMGNAVVMHATGGSWTIGTKYFDGINYGLFYSDTWLEQIVKKEVEELKRLKAKKIMIGECGHASRSAKQFLPVFCGGKNAPVVVNCMEYALEMLEKGKLKLNPDIITETVTYHDPCNIARNGWIVDQPREILKSFVKNYVEMTPGGKNNLCCGGGGGTVSIDEIREYRTGTVGKKKAEQIRDTGADIVVSPCANCKKQLREVCEDNGLEHVQVVGLHDLILKAIEL
ncbi:(Fe-S)-binding protein [candidate division KSB1 bacterium]